ncbi:10214_t:CDS:2 [Diversispora eburnea]|uniref:10214_t:CDS:1 n=1 Tax=Diversispora eburnea TaxID=1213867 RepID=A0A9N9G442_9GLOM|nr:10214_t:CDS:2 [Diversispora eburnea]
MLTTYQSDAFVGILYGAAVIVSLHNFIISIVLYKARKSNVSNINKIILNLSCMILFLFRFVLAFAPTWIDLSGCHFISYMAHIVTFFYGTSLAIFLLWRLRQIESSQLDKWASIILLSTRTIAHLTTFGFVRVFLSKRPLRNWCIIDQTRLKIPETITVVIDFLIDIYITVRLVQVLRIANENAAGLGSSVGRKTKRTLFTAVMYWNFVRLAVAFGLNLITVVVLVTRSTRIGSIPDQLVAITFFNTFFFILMSYVVTVDAEIVKVIEGENQNKKGSSKSTSEKSSYPSSPTNRATAGSGSLPKYNTSDTPTSPTSKNDYDISMKRLSFFEWANFVLGFRHENNNMQEFTQKEFEEIIGGSSEANNRDPEKGETTNDPNRNSNISGGSTIIIPDV